MILIVVVPILLMSLLVIRSARVRSQEKQQLLNEQAQGILGSGFGGTTAGPCFVGPFFFPFLPAFGAVRVAIRVFCALVVIFWHLPGRLGFWGEAKFQKAKQKRLI